MAGEITLSTSLSVRHSPFEYNHTSRQTIDQNGIGGGNPGTVQLTTTAQAVSFGDVSTPGIVVFQNLDSTDSVYIGIDVASTFYPFAQLKPGEDFVIRVYPTLALYAKAVTNTANLFVFCNEN